MGKCSCVPGKLIHVGKYKTSTILLKMKQVGSISCYLAYHPAEQYSNLVRKFVFFCGFKFTFAGPPEATQSVGGDAGADEKGFEYIKDPQNCPLPRVFM